VIRRGIDRCRQGTSAPPVRGVLSQDSSAYFLKFVRQSKMSLDENIGIITMSSDTSPARREKSSAQTMASLRFHHGRFGSTERLPACHAAAATHGVNRVAGIREL
jgi:hypothetical protein